MLVPRSDNRQQRGSIVELPAGTRFNGKFISRAARTAELKVNCCVESVLGVANTPPLYQSNSNENSSAGNRLLPYSFYARATNFLSGYAECHHICFALFRTKVYVFLDLGPMEVLGLSIFTGHTKILCFSSFMK